MVHEWTRRAAACERGHRSAFAAEVSCERTPDEHAGIRRSLQLQGGLADGEREERHLPRLVKQGVADSPLLARIAFILGLIFAVSPWGSPPLALAVGLLLGLLSLNPFCSQIKSV